VLVPELYSSARSFWYLRRRLRAVGWSCVAGLPRTRRTSGPDAIAALDACTARLAAATDLVLVGHGIGGLLAHRYAQQRPHLPIRHVVTLATPHGGSASLPYRLLAGSAGPHTGPPPAAPADVDVIAIYSAFDAWLQPLDNAYCPGGFNIDVRGIGHCATLLSRRVADLVVENLAATLVSARSPRAAAPADS
jgi:pimeloyl-ACP methyl ester carboxylesterase